MKLPFILGMEVLRRVHAQLDLKACMLTLCGDNGSAMEVFGSYKQIIIFSSRQLYNTLASVVLQNAPLIFIATVNIRNFAKGICSPYLSLYQSLDT